MRVVVVDDEPDARALARMVLERGGHEVHTARHPDEALQILAQVEVDVVLTDLHMPRMDGEELARMIADLHPDVTCIVWSALAGGEREDVRPKDVLGLRIDEWVGGTAVERGDEA
jgi:CheY-like chemotaxis protein